MVLIIHEMGLCRFAFKDFIDDFRSNKELLQKYENTLWEHSRTGDGFFQSYAHAVNKPMVEMAQI